VRYYVAGLSQRADYGAFSTFWDARFFQRNPFFDPCIIEIYVSFIENDIRSLDRKLFS